MKPWGIIRSNKFQLGSSNQNKEDIFSMLFCSLWFGRPKFRTLVLLAVRLLSKQLNNSLKTSFFFASQHVSLIAPRYGFRSLKTVNGTYQQFQVTTVWKHLGSGSAQPEILHLPLLLPSKYNLIFNSQTETLNCWDFCLNIFVLVPNFSLFWFDSMWYHGYFIYLVHRGIYAPFCNELILALF